MRIGGRPRLVGRERELELVRDALESVDRGSGLVAVMAGPAGIGKTRLLAEAARSAAARGATVLHGRASELERALPFSVVVDALDDYLRALGDDDLAGLAAEDRAELARVFPAFRGATGTPAAAGTSPDDRVRAYFAVRRLLEELARSRPLVLVVDDLHWADRASVELLAHLIRRPPGGRVLIFAGYRPTQAEEDLVVAVTRAQHEGTATYVEPGPLTPPDVTELLEVTGAERDRLHELSGGNPFLLLELAKAGGTADVTRGADLPGAVADAIVAGLAPLSPSARALAETAAAAGDPFDADLAFGVAGVAEEAGLDALDELARIDLVARTDVPRRFAWRHPLVRHAVYTSLLPGRRLAVHRRCAELLAERGADAAERAVHVQHSARPGDLEAVEVLTNAATEVAGRAPASAVAWLRAALRLLPADSAADARLPLLVRLPPLLTALGQVAEAHTCLVEALALVPDGEPALKVRLATTCAGLDQALGNHDDARDRLLRTLEELPDGTARESVDPMVALVIDSYYRTDRAAMQEWGARAVDVAAGCGDRPRLAAAHAAMALGYALDGQVAPADEHRAAATGLVDAMSDADLGEHVEAIGYLATAEIYLDRYEQSVYHAERALRVARAAGRLAALPLLIPALSTALGVVGRVTEVLELTEEAIESARAARDTQGVAWHLFNRAWAFALAGDLEAARRCSEESRALARQLGDTVVGMWSGTVAALVVLECGEPRAAIDLLHEAAGPDLAGLPGGWRCVFGEVAVRGWLELGEADRAEDVARVLAEWAESVGLPYGRGAAGRAAARCALHRGDAESAAEQARSAMAHSREASARYEVATTQVLLGEALRRCGAVDEAVAELREAVAELETMGAVRRLGEAERELGRLGSRPHRRTTPGAGDSGLAALTSRELEVARLVVDRRTNPEIAATLFLSIKTVETHLRNIFRKLDVESRNDVARALEAAVAQGAD